MRSIRRGPGRARIAALTAFLVVAVQPTDVRAGSTGADLRFVARIEPGENPSVSIQLRMDDLPTDRNWIGLAMQPYSFTRLPEPIIENLRPAIPQGGVLIERANAYEWDVKSGGATQLALHYRIPLRHRQDPDVIENHDQYEHPYLAADHGLLATPALFMHPTDIAVETIRVKFEAPEGWPVIAPWRSTRPNEFDPGRRHELLDDLIAVGAWDLHAFQVGEFEGRIAFAPGQEALIEPVLETVPNIVRYQLDLFDRPAEGRYLFLFGRPDGPGMAGSPKRASMTLQADRKDPKGSARRLNHLIAHEFFHTWSKELRLPGELRWVNEGITDYFAYLTLARTGVHSWERFGEVVAERMNRCAANPLWDEMSISAAGGDPFFKDQDANQLVYQGGFLLGLWLDLAIRERGEGFELIDLMRAFVNDAEVGPDDVPPGAVEFLELVAFMAGEEISEALLLELEQPYAFDPSEALGALGLAVEHTIGSPELSLRANLDGCRVGSIDPNGLGHRIGIRQGDLLLDLNGRSVNNAAQVWDAFRRTEGNRVSVRLFREGETIEIDEPIPPRHLFSVPVREW